MKILFLFEHIWFFILINQKNFKVNWYINLNMAGIDLTDLFK